MGLDAETDRGEIEPIELNRLETEIVGNTFPTRPGTQESAELWPGEGRSHALKASPASAPNTFCLACCGKEKGPGRARSDEPEASRLSRVRRRNSPADSRNEKSSDPIRHQTGEDDRARQNRGARGCGRARLSDVLWFAPGAVVLRSFLAIPVRTQKTCAGMRWMPCAVKRITRSCNGSETR